MSRPIAATSRRGNSVRFTRGPLAAVELSNRVGVDRPGQLCRAKHAPECDEASPDRPGGERFPLRLDESPVLLDEADPALHLGDQTGDVVDADLRQPPTAEARVDVLAEKTS